MSSIVVLGITLQVKKKLLGSSTNLILWNTSIVYDLMSNKNYEYIQLSYYFIQLSFSIIIGD